MTNYVLILPYRVPVINERLVTTKFGRGRIVLSNKFHKFYRDAAKDAARVMPQVLFPLRNNETINIDYWVWANNKTDHDAHMKAVGDLFGSYFFINLDGSEYTDHDIRLVCKDIKPVRLITDMKAEMQVSIPDSIIPMSHDVVFNALLKYKIKEAIKAKRQRIAKYEISGLELGLDNSIRCEVRTGKGN